jgi:hypothetical protein
VSQSADPVMEHRAFPCFHKIRATPLVQIPADVAVYNESGWF